MKLKSFIYLVLATALVSACGTTKNIPYFQDVTADGTSNPVQASKIVIRPHDQISIIVYTQDSELTNMFNLPYYTSKIGQMSSTASNYTQGICGYLVDDEGNIDFPVLGQVHIAGLTREQTAKHVKEMLQASALIKDPVVTVDFMNLRFSVLGEVNNPGYYNIVKDDMTILDAISDAGDLTIYGMRDKVTVLRMEDGVQKAYKVNLCSTKELSESPVFYLQQNDVIYVEPNKMRVRQSTVNGNSVLSASFWVSIASLTASVASILIRL